VLGIKPRTTSSPVNESLGSCGRHTLDDISEATRTTFAAVIDRFDFTREYSASVTQILTTVAEFLRLRHHHQQHYYSGSSNYLLLIAVVNDALNSRPMSGFPRAPAYIALICRRNDIRLADTSVKYDINTLDRDAIQNASHS